MAAISPAASQLDQRVAGLALSAQEQQILAALQPAHDDPMRFLAAAKLHAAAGFLTQQDALMLNYPLMINPEPAAQALLAKLRAAVSADPNKHTAPNSKEPRR